MANKEGQQIDTLPVQAYGLDGAVIRKIAVDADGKVKISGGGGSQTPWTSDIDAAGYNINNLGVLYLGDSSTNGSWRIRVSGTSLVMERRESGVWVEKSAATA